MFCAVDSALKVRYLLLSSLKFIDYHTSNPVLNLEHSSHSHHKSVNTLSIVTWWET